MQKRNSTFPGLIKSNPLDGKNVDALKDVASQAPVTIGAREEAAPPAPAEPAKPAQNRPAGPTTGSAVRAAKEGTTQITPRLPTSLVEAIRFLRGVEDRSDAYVITKFAGEIIKNAARERGWNG